MPVVMLCFLLLLACAQDKNCILADEVGLGRTVQCVSFLGLLAEMIGNRGPFLVLVPPSTVSKWLEEFKKWVPQVRKGVQLA
jgi:chromodomain-helicase-DNA-binding protein 1